MEALAVAVTTGDNEGELENDNEQNSNLIAGAEEDDEEEDNDDELGQQEGCEYPELCHLFPAIPLHSSSLPLSFLSYSETSRLSLVCLFRQ